MLSTVPISAFPEATPPATPIEYDVIRDDGQILRYTMQGGAVTNPPGITIRFSLTGSGYTVIDDDDNTETYDATGALQTITSRGGRVQTLAYSSGVWTGVTDSFGNAISISRNAFGQISSVAVTGGGTVVYGYDSTNRLTSVTYPDSSSRGYSYGDSRFPNALTSIQDESGAAFVSWTYDAQERGSTTQNAGGVNYALLTYNSDGSVTATDALGATRTFSYTRIGDINRVTAISGSQCPTCEESAATTYDAAGFVSSRTDYNGNLTCYANDPNRGLELVRVEGFVSGSTCPPNLATYSPSGPTQRKITTTWHSTWREPVSIVEANRTTSLTYDSFGNVQTKAVTDTSVSPGASRTWTYSYNGFGQVLTIDGPRTDVTDTTTIVYYTCTSGSSCGQIHTITNAAGQVTTFNTYNAYGHPLTITDPNGTSITLSYDAEQRLTSRQVGSETSGYSYYPTGLLKTVTQPDGSTLTYNYNAAHQLTSIVDEAGNSLKLTPDALSNVTAIQTYDASNNLHFSHTRTFNTLSRLSQDIGAAGGSGVTTSYYYDSNGNPTSITAPLSRTTGEQYDALNRVTQVTDPASGIMQVAYDANDNVHTVTDPQSLTTTYNYNGFGDLSSQASPQTGTTSNTYDSGGNLATSTDARGAVATFQYDALNRVISAAYQLGGVTDQTISFTYDSGTNGKGHLTGASDANHALAWYYDGNGRIIGRGQTVGGTALGVGYGYTNGNLAAITTPSGQTITYSYANHQITGIAINTTTTLLSGVTYEPLGAVSGWTWGNSTTEVRSHTADGNPYQVGGPEVVTLGYDNAFRITSATNAANSALSWSYNGYDNLDRLTSATQSGNSLGWGYTSDGDRQSQTGASTPSTLWTSSPTFTYNNQGRMSAATTATSSTTYIYDALGELVRKANTTTTLLAYDEAGHLVGEYTSSGALIQETVWLGDIPVATLRPNGASISIYYIHADQLGAPRLITRPSDNASMWRWDADPFGTAPANQNPQGMGTFVYDLRFPGQYYQVETGLNFNYFRDYEPQTGRYLESDPIGLDGGSYSTYSYGSGNPISNIDPLGLKDTVPGYVFPTLPYAPGTPENTALGNLLTQAADNFNNNTSYLGNAIGAGLYNLLNNDPNAMAAKPYIDDPQAQAEHDQYKRQYDEPPPPFKDECEELAWLIKREQNLMQGRKAWDAKWMPGRHDGPYGEIQSQNRINKFKKRMEALGCKQCP